MEGQLQWHKPIEHSVLLSNAKAIRRFNACGWLGYFLKSIEFDEEAATKFTNTFEEGEAIVWGLIVVAIEEWIEEVMRLPAAREHYPNEHDAISSRA